MRDQEVTVGFTLGLVAYGIWGLFPLFFNLLAAVEPTQILMHRVIWSCLFVALLLAATQGWRGIRAHLRNPRLWRTLAFSSLLIAANWLIFIYAVAQKQVLASSLGYFMTPLVSTALAVLFLGEALNRFRLLAIGLALFAIVWQLLQLGHIPWIPVCLALSFGTYGLVRKQAPVATLPGLFMETLILLPIALLYWAWLGIDGSSQFRQSSGDTWLLLASGVVTALPLLAFAAAAKRLSLMSLGFMMYLNPSLQFFTATVLFDEPFSGGQLVSFICVWAALAVFTLDAVRQRRRVLPA